jgi:dTDP-4-dehydrorhamnose reductase
MRVVVLGGSGMLGSMLVRYLSPHYDVVATVRDKAKIIKTPNEVDWHVLDVTESWADRELKTVVGGADWIINAIGAIPQRGDNPGMETINAEFPYKLSKLGIPVIQIATDCVYSGDRGCYLETDQHDYRDQYGLSKSDGETMGETMHHLRCSIIGIEPFGNYSLLSWFLSQPLNARIQGYNNHLWNGITTLHFAKLCQGIINNSVKLPHLQHIVPVCSVSKAWLLEYFREMFDRTDIDLQYVNHERTIDRRLSTINPTLNRKLWAAAGYVAPPTIRDIVQELAEWYKGVKDG